MKSDVTISEVLLPALEAAFPASGLRVATTENLVAVFPAACSEVGGVLIYDDGDEATVDIENITHYHFNPYDSEISPYELALWVTNEVVEFLQALFDDRVLLWSRQQGRGGGGSLQPYEGVIPDYLPEDADIFVWSRRLERTG